MDREIPPPVEICWEVIVCRECGRRIYNDDGTEAKSWRRWIGCLCAAAATGF